MSFIFSTCQPHADIPFLYWLPAIILPSASVPAIHSKSGTKARLPSSPYGEVGQGLTGLSIPIRQLLIIGALLGFYSMLTQSSGNTQTKSNKKRKPKNFRIKYISMRLAPKTQKSPTFVFQ
jgi:hypothetical protein